MQTVDEKNLFFRDTFKVSAKYHWRQTTGVPRYIEARFKAKVPERSYCHKPVASAIKVYR